jgi:hypothetical protein
MSGKSYNGLKLLVFMLALSQVYGIEKCGHYHMRERVEKISKSFKLNHRYDSSTREQGWANIRIKVEYYKSHVGDTALDFIQSEVINNSIKWFENVLNVKRLRTPIKLERYLGIENYLGNPGYSVPSYLYNRGADADYIFFIGIVSDSSLGWVGAASSMIQDNQTKQPIVGMFDLNYYDGFSYEDLLSTTIHEMAHALGFANNLFEDFIKPNGENYRKDEVVKTEYVNGRKVAKIITPKVVNLARETFGCSTMNGVELELQGGEGTAGSHWEKRIMYQDFMGPDSDMNDIVYSDISMALFEDSGWYTVNYKYTTKMTWGSKAGCDFINGPCIKNGKPTSRLYCNDYTKNTCDFNRLNKGVCGMANYNYIDPEYQYFSYDSTLGGSDMYLDFCPVVKQFFGGNCRGLEPTPTQTESDYGEQVCENCRCIEGTYSKIYVPHNHAACHWVECKKGYSLIHVGQQVVKYPAKGGSVKVPGYDGVLYCPTWQEVCDPAPCMNACSGIGICNRGVCECPDGSKGGDCATIAKDFSYRDPLPKTLKHAENMIAEENVEDGVESSAKVMSMIATMAILMLF